MREDPIVEEVRRVRREHAERLGFNVRAIVRDLKERQRAGGRRYLSLPSRRIKEEAVQ
jgi:hypothetical protein